jgi:hypothetical protein
VIYQGVKKEEIVYLKLNDQQPVDFLCPTQLRKMLILFKDILKFSSTNARFFRRFCSKRSVFGSSLLKIAENHTGNSTQLKELCKWTFCFFG